jgi:hypothetical protein
MKLTLRTARKLENKISSKISEGIEYNVTFSAYDKSSVEEKFVKANNNARIDVTTALELTRVRYDIRRQIQQLNEESGINQLVSERKKLIEILSIWKEVKGCVNVSNSPVSVEIIEGKLEAIRNGGITNANSYTSPRDSVTVNVVTDEFAEDAEEAIHTLEKAIEEIEDNVLAANMGTKVTLTDLDVTFLREHALL